MEQNVGCSFFWATKLSARWKKYCHPQDHTFFSQLMNYGYKQPLLTPKDQDCLESEQCEDNTLQAEHWFGHDLPSDLPQKALKHGACDHQL